MAALRAADTASPHDLRKGNSRYELEMRRPSEERWRVFSWPCRLFGGAAALGACAGDRREGARPRASRYGLGSQRPRRAASGPGDLAGARAAFERELTIREKALGPKHPD